MKGFPPEQSSSGSKVTLKSPPKTQASQAHLTSVLLLCIRVLVNLLLKEICYFVEKLKLFSWVCSQVDVHQQKRTILNQRVYNLGQNCWENCILGGHFSKLRSRPILPSPLPLEAVLLGLQKKAGSLSICRKQLWTGGGGFLYAKPLIWK